MRSRVILPVSGLALAAAIIAGGCSISDSHNAKHHHKHTVKLDHQTEKELRWLHDHYYDEQHGDHHRRHADHGSHSDIRTTTYTIEHHDRDGRKHVHKHQHHHRHND